MQDHRQTLLRAGALLLALAGGAAVAGLTPIAPPYVQAAVAEPSRPERDRDRDADRLPAQVTVFAGIKPGDQVAELLPGRGYFTRIFCRVVGDKGHVYAVSINRAIKPTRPPASDDEAQANPCTNVTADSKDADDFSLPSGLDVVWTSENYHDLHNKMFGPPDIHAFDSAIFKALKPGGVFVVEDHAAEPGSGARDTDTLHRIDQKLVVKEVTSVGFVLDSSSNLLHHADDPHTAKVFDLHDKTDRFLLKFRKPKGHRG
ncbi:MAG: class I SAM-dependent methyltransferase [Steroidobacteraceae bacterium]